MKLKPLLIAASLVFFSLLGLSRDTLVVGYNIAPPFVEKENDVLKGPSIWLCDQLKDDLGLEFRYVQYPLDSLLIKLGKGEIDICASPLTITSERSRTIDFTAPYYIAHSSLLLHKQESSGYWGSIKSFFSLAFFEVLGAFAVIILIFGFLTWIFERKKNEEQFGNGVQGLWNGFWWSAVTMTTVGYGDMAPKTAPGRLIAIIWMFTAVVIISGFTASIASALTRDNISDSPRTIEEFKKRHIATVDQSGTNKWLTDNFYSKTLTYSNIDSCVIALESGDVEAIAYDRPILKEFVKNNPKKQLEVGREKFNAQYYSMGMSKHLDQSLRDSIYSNVLKQTERMDWKVLLSESGLEAQ